MYKRFTGFMPLYHIWEVFRGTEICKILFAITLKNTIGGLQAAKLSNSLGEMVHEVALLYSNCHKYS